MSEVTQEKAKLEADAASELGVLKVKLAALEAKGSALVHVHVGAVAAVAAIVGVILGLLLAKL